MEHFNASCTHLKFFALTWTALTAMFVPMSHFVMDYLAILKLNSWVVHLYKLVRKTPAPVAALSKARTVCDRSNTGIVGSNPAQGMDVCPRFSVLCCER